MKSILFMWWLICCLFILNGCMATCGGVGEFNPSIPLEPPVKNNDQVVKSNPRESPKKNPPAANPNHKLKMFITFCMRLHVNSDHHSNTKKECSKRYLKPMDHSVLHQIMLSSDGDTLAKLLINS